jgi:hypothetical protein
LEQFTICGVLRRVFPPLIAIFAVGERGNTFPAVIIIPEIRKKFPAVCTPVKADGGLLIRQFAYERHFAAIVWASLHFAKAFLKEKPDAVEHVRLCRFPSVLQIISHLGSIHGIESQVAAPSSPCESDRFLVGRVCPANKPGIAFRTVVICHVELSFPGELAAQENQFASVDRTRLVVR